MITADRTPAELGDAIGYTAIVVIVGVLVVAGLFLLALDWRDQRAGDRFSDDLIPDRIDVAATEQRHVIGDGRIATAINRTIRVARERGAL